MTVMRRMMIRIMVQLLIERQAEAIVTGESLGQVASQTLTSMNVINSVTHSPVLRPLIAVDKNEIIELAEKVGTYDISNEPYEDCCTVFAPSSPKTKPRQGKIEFLEESLDIEALVQDAVQNIEIEVIDAQYITSQQAEFDDLL